MRSRIVAAAIAAGLLEASAALAQDPCAEDVKQLCPEVRAGGGRVQECLRKNEAKLSPACKEKRAAADKKMLGLVEEFAVACRSDIGRLCSDVPRGQGRVIACLIRQQDDLSSACRAHAQRFETATDTVNAVRAACTADVERVCPGVPAEAGPLVECLQANRESLSETCRGVDPEMGMAAAELVDAVAALTSKERIQEALQILQGTDSIAFSRSQIILQVDSFQGLGGSANATRMLFNPQFVFGDHNQFALQLKAPVVAVYPYSPERSAQNGLGAVNTSFAWAFWGSKRVHQYLSAGLQWKSPMEPPVGAAWAVVPSYAISVGLARWLSITGQVAWIRSFASSGYPELHLLLFEPIVVVNLPGRTFAALDSRLAWNIEESSFVPLLKGIIGLYIDRRKSLSISAWYQHALSKEAEAQAFKFEVGMGLAYFFDW